MHGRHEGKRGERKRAEDILNEEGREQGREGNFKEGSIFTNKPLTNWPLLLRLWYYK